MKRSFVPLPDLTTTQQVEKGRSHDRAQWVTKYLLVPFPLPLIVVRENQTELIVVPVLLVGVFVVVLSIILWLHYLSWRTKRQTSQDCDVKGEGSGGVGGKLQGSVCMEGAGLGPAPLPL